MLKLRVITALVLLPIVLGAMFFLERQAFAGVAALFFLAGGWEWSGMMRAPGKAVRVIWLASLAGLLLAAETLRPAWLLTLLPAWWLLALVLVVAYPRLAGGWFRLPVLAVLGYLLLVPSWAAVVHLQDQGALGLDGFWALLFVLLWVWAADTGAYFAGRAFGRHKLAPSVSPGKTLEGLVGGAALALLVAGLVAWQGPVTAAIAPLLLVALVTVVASVLGDLFESMIKRQVGIKDSGTLLPGHGGMLDRIDSVTAALPVAVAMLSLTGLPGGL
ncbi:MAG: phosphatidate cytidylyltransferase [Alcanivoracaceae bacterium]|jgi:phosphatidate cytidylyltransferase|nr:phosphatidate cytidylyltransferase [Alcanivoracaceae bacterium]